MNTTSDPHDATNPDGEETSSPAASETTPHPAETASDLPDGTLVPDPAGDIASPPAPTSDAGPGVDAPSGPAAHEPDIAAPGAAVTPPAPGGFPADLDISTPLGSVLHESGVTARSVDPARTPDLSVPADFGAITRTLPDADQAAAATSYSRPSPQSVGQPATPTAPTRAATFGVALVASMLGALLLLGGLWAFGVFDDPVNPAIPATTAAPSAAPVATQPPVGLIEPTGGYDPVQVGNRVVPSVVAIEVGDEVDGEFSRVASGSGVIIDSSGLIVTNNHVVEGSTAVQVTLFDGRIFDATVEGTDPITDLALLKIEATGLTPIAIGNTDQLSIGSGAIAIGSPLALVGGPSLSVGVISAFDREVNTQSNRLFGMLQTDAAINPGSSGGALVNDRGELIGIVTAVAVSDRGPEGIGFATPVEVMTRIIDELRATGTVRHAFLGIIGATYVADLEDGSMRPSGAEIVDFAPDSAAQDAGLQIGDTIVAVDGVEYRTMDSLIIALRFYSVGDTIQVEVIRNGEEVTVPVILGERPDDL
jgi:putative serine protease PepD